jgi:hypothetical protein
MKNVVIHKKRKIVRWLVPMLFVDPVLQLK